MSLSKPGSVEDVKDNMSAEDLAWLYKTRKFCDVKFVVGSHCDKESFQAHQTILANRSCVFTRMFLEPGQEAEEKYRVRDIKPGVFENMLKYVYLGEIPEGDELVILDLLKVAQKYLIEDLKCMCTIQLVNMTLNPEYVCLVYEAACDLGDEDLKTYCGIYLCDMTSDIFASNGFLVARQSTVSVMAQLQIAHVQSEMEVVEALLKWARHRAQESGMTIRHEFEQFLPYICMRNIKGVMWALLLEKYPGVFTYQEATLIFMLKCNPCFRGFPEWCQLSNNRIYTNYRESFFYQYATKRIKLSI